MLNTSSGSATSAAARQILGSPAKTADRARRSRLTLAAAQAEDAQQEGAEEDLNADDQHRGGDDGQAFVGQRPEAVADPADQDHGAERDADEHEGSAQQQPVLEPEASPH